MKFNLKDSIKILSKTTNVIKVLLIELQEPWIKTNEGKDTWSPYDIVGHLIHGEKTDWLLRTKIILSDKKDKTFIHFDRFAQMENSKGKSLAQLLKEFRKLRKKNIKALKAMKINAKKLKMTGVHPELGTVNLKQLLATWVVHDLSHINQITRVMAKNYTAEVGPWIKYISILQKEKK